MAVSKDPRAKRFVDRLSTLKSDRGTWEDHWRQIAELMRPLRNDFQTRWQPGQKRMGKVYDGTALMAADSFAGGLSGMMTNPSTDWFAVEHEDDDLNQVEEVKIWFELATAAMRNEFAGNGARFYQRVNELYADLACFGTALFFEDAREGQVRFQHHHLAQSYIAVNDDDDVDTVMREWEWTARQARQRFPDLPEKIAQAAEKKPDEKFKFLHATLPNEDYEPRKRFDRRAGRPFKSCWIAIDECAILAEDGFYEFPYQVPRWSTATGGPYGDSPGMIALADTRMLNAMSRTTIIAAQKVVDPPILTAHERNMRGDERLTPGRTIYRGIDEQGRPLYAPLTTNAQVPLSLEMEEQRRQAIREAFFYSLMLMAQSPNATATEILQRQEEKLRLMGPQLGRVQAEFLDALIARVFALMLRMGSFPPPPALLLRYPNWRIRYISPLARAQKVREAAAVTRIYSAAGMVAAIDPQALDNLDGDVAVRTIAQAEGAPARLLRDPRQVQQLRQQRAQAQQAQQLAAMAAPAKDAAGAIKTIREAAQPGAAP